MEYILSGIIVILIIVGYVERKQYSEKLMAKSLKEYKEITEKPEPNHLDDDDNLVPIEEAEKLINE